MENLYVAENSIRVVDALNSEGGIRESLPGAIDSGAQFKQSKEHKFMQLHNVANMSEGLTYTGWVWEWNKAGRQGGRVPTVFVFQTIKFEF